MTKSITIASVRAPILKGLLCTAGTKDIRYYLNGIFVDPKHGRMVSTTGHVLTVVAVEMTAGANVEAPFIIPRDLIESVLKVTKSPQEVIVEISGVAKADADAPPGSRRRTITLCSGIAKFQGLEVDGAYPDFTRAVDANPSGEPAQFNPALLLEAQTALSYIGLGKRAGALLSTVYNGENGALISERSTSGKAFCVVMPWRNDGARREVASAMEACGFKLNEAEDSAPAKAA